MRIAARKKQDIFPHQLQNPENWQALHNLAFPYIKAYFRANTVTLFAHLKHSTNGWERKLRCQFLQKSWSLLITYQFGSARFITGVSYFDEEARMKIIYFSKFLVFPFFHISKSYDQSHHTYIVVLVVQHLVSVWAL